MGEIKSMLIVTRKYEYINLGHVILIWRNNKMKFGSIMVKYNYCSIIKSFNCKLKCGKPIRSRASQAMRMKKVIYKKNLY